MVKAYRALMSISLLTPRQPLVRVSAGWQCFPGSKAGLGVAGGIVCVLSGVILRRPTRASTKLFICIAPLSLYCVRPLPFIRVNVRVFGRMRASEIPPSVALERQKRGLFQGYQYAPLINLCPEAVTER